jgi:threonine/homoserine/homoserine lactone efflux protein
MLPTGIVFIVGGLLWLLWPGMYQHGLLKVKSISQRLLTPEQDRVFMRIVGGVFVAIGLALVVFHFAF